jgi:hypothetical protein
LFSNTQKIRICWQTEFCFQGAVRPINHFQSKKEMEESDAHAEGVGWWGLHEWKKMFACLLACLQLAVIN